MTHEAVRDLETGFHPRVILWMVLTVVWVVVAAWLFFAVDTHARILLAFVAISGLGFLAVPVIFWLLAGREHPTERPETFAEWLRHRFDTHTGPLAAGEAALTALIAPLAAAITITVVGAIAWTIGSATP